ncbi:MAG: hypothetical protein KJ587_02850 [Alphaproteobacteria bacterium]|nr:hypothetical protein [Alphaproteobacteria bacterium]
MQYCRCCARFFAFFLLLPLAGSAWTATLTDSAGRRVEVPDKIEKVFAAGPPAAILFYVLAPERMTGDWHCCGCSFGPPVMCWLRGNNSLAGSGRMDNILRPQ